MVLDDSAAATEPHANRHRLQRVRPRRLVPLLLKGLLDQRIAELQLARGDLLRRPRLVALIETPHDLRIGKRLPGRSTITARFRGPNLDRDLFVDLRRRFAHFPHAFLAQLLRGLLRRFWLFLFRPLLLGLLVDLCHDVSDDLLELLGLLRLFHLRLRLGLGFRLRRLRFHFLQGRRFVLLAVQILVDDDGEVDRDDLLLLVEKIVTSRIEPEKNEGGDMQDERNREIALRKDFRPLRRVVAYPPDFHQFSLDTSPRCLTLQSLAILTIS